MHQLQYLVNYIFKDFLDIFVVYLDDTLISSISVELHHTHVQKVLTQLRQHGLYTKPENCEFEQRSIQFLGLIISPERIKMAPKTFLPSCSGLHQLIRKEYSAS